MVGIIATSPLLTGHMVNEPVDADDPNGDVLAYDSDTGPFGMVLRCVLSN